MWSTARDVIASERVVLDKLAFEDPFLDVAGSEMRGYLMMWCVGDDAICKRCLRYLVVGDSGISIFRVMEITACGVPKRVRVTRSTRIPLADIASVLSVAHNRTAFKIITGGGKYNMIAPTMRARRAWVGAVKQVRERARLRLPCIRSIFGLSMTWP